MKFDKGMMLIDAMLALLIVMIVASISFSFISVYYRFDRFLIKEEGYEEEESGFDYD